MLGELDLRDCKSLRSLPAGLKIRGGLDLKRCKGLESLPAGLVVGGQLELEDCTSLTSLPADLKVERGVYLEGCTALESLPVGFKVSGTVTTHWGIPMPNTTVRLTESSGTSVVVVTDTLGRFVFENVAGGGSYSVLPERDINDLNGITTLDMVLISKHILGIQSLNSPWKMIAADVNNSKSITTFDIVEARKVLLGIYPAIPATSSWRFLPAATVFSDPNNPFNGTPAPETITITNLQADYLQANFKGIKIADVNNSADPGQ